MVSALLHGVDHQIIPDRIEAGSSLSPRRSVVARFSEGRARRSSRSLFLIKLREAGVSWNSDDGGIHVRGGSRIKSVDVKTLPYPGFPTDLQAQMMVLMAVADGVNVITETIFENRFMHVPELDRMGADIKLEGKSRGGARRQRTVRRSGDGERLARQCGAGARRSGRQRQHRSGPRLSSRPRLRTDRKKAFPTERADCTDCRVSLFKVQKFKGSRTEIVTGSMKIRLVKTSDAGFKPLMARILGRRGTRAGDVQTRVGEIVTAVQRQGDRAVLRYTAQFDHVRLRAATLEVTAAEIATAVAQVSRKDLSILRLAAKRIGAFHRRQILKSWQYRDPLGMVLGQRITPLGTGRCLRSRRAKPPIHRRC